MIEQSNNQRTLDTMTNNQETTSATVNYSNESIASLASIVRRNWTKVYFGAVPYLDAMCQMGTINEDYGYDSGVSIVLYFLANANTWRGPVAKEVKKELNKRCKSASYSKPHANSAR
jgi:hypothetical protein